MKLILSLLFFSTFAQADIPDGVYAELAKFSMDGKTLPADYIQNFPKQIERLSIESEHSILKSTAECIPDVSIQTRLIVTPSVDPIVREFEEGLIRIEATACLPLVNANVILSNLTAPVFRKTVIKTIQQIYTRDGMDCEITNAPGFGRSNYCSVNQLELRSDLSLARNFNAWNDEDLVKYTVPVYYRSVFEASAQTNDHTVYHMITYIRATKPTPLQKLFIPGFISEIEKSVLTALKESLK
jgi:hypothetical protein